MPLLEQGRGFVNEVVQETKKVAWPTRNELREATLVVIVSVFVVSIVVGLIDLGFSWALKFIIRSS
jgi:preprotein translocase subunit SecE